MYLVLERFQSQLAFILQKRMSHQMLFIKKIIHINNAITLIAGRMYLVIAHFQLHSYCRSNPQQSLGLIKISGYKYIQIFVCIKIVIGSSSDIRFCQKFHPHIFRYLFVSRSIQMSLSDLEEEKRRDKKEKITFVMTTQKSAVLSCPRKCRVHKVKL